MRRIRNRICVAAVAAALVFLLIAIVSAVCQSCSSKATAVSSVKAETSSVASTEPPTQKTTQKATQSTASTVSMPAIKDDGSEGYLDSSIYIWQKMGFELFYGTDSSAKTYAEAISGYKQKLGDSIKVYNMIVPNHTEYGLPERLKTGLTNSQRDNMNTVFASYTADVTPVDIYDALGANRDKYIYYNTDHHWTGLGAYYAYTAFAKTAGLEPIKLDESTKKSIKGFTGSLYRETNGNSDLASNLDTVDYYEIPGTYNVSITDASGNVSEGSLYYENAESGDNTYGVFLWGDNPFTKIVNTSTDSTKKLCIVKESFGNAFVPYVCSNYKEVYVVDFRYYTGNLKDLCTKNKISEVLYMNGVMSESSAFQIEKMDALLS